MPSLLDSIEGAHQKLLRPSGGCHVCPRRRVDFVPATLTASPILWLGEAPGAEEVKKSKGFVGRAGEKLRSHASDVGLKVEACSNSIHCRPPNNATPKTKEISCCLNQFVLEEIRDYPIIVLCGSVPLQALFPHAKATHFRGNIAHHPDFPGQRFYAIYHPAYILRRPDLEGQLSQQMERLARIVQGEPAPTWKLHQGGGDAYWKALQKTLASPLISLDLEANRLESWDVHAKMRSIALTADAKTVVFAHEDQSTFIRTLKLIQGYLESPEKAVVGAHIGFDLEWLERDLEFAVRTGVHDVAVIYYQAKQYTMPSLKELVSRELDGYRYLVYNPATEKDLILLSNYNAEDVIYPLQLFRKGIRLLKPKTRDLVTRIMSPTDLILQRIHTTGFYLRPDYRQAKIDEYEKKRRKAVWAWKEEDPEFIPSTHESGKGLKQYLFKIKGLPSVGQTEKGDPTTDKAALKQWIHDGATYLRHLLVIKGCDKILSTYLRGYDKYLGPDRRVHPDFTLTLLPTGRSSARKPNSQNVPRDTEIRDLFGAPPGSILVEFDLNQAEFRIMVCRAKDETGINAYLRGEDAHTTTAKAFAPNPTKTQRSHAKPVNFSLLYGGDWYNVQSIAKNDYDLHWSDKQCRKFTDAFFDTYRSLPAFHKACEVKLIENRGWFESIVGHVFYYRDWNHPNKDTQDHTIRAALNNEAQGPAAQICFYIMVVASRLFNERKLPVAIVNTVHDSALLEVKDPKQVANVVQALEEARTLVYEWIKPWFLVPLVVDYTVGESWGSLEPFNGD